MLRYKKKIIGCILILFFYLSSNLFSTNVFAASTKKVIYNENGCQIEFVLNSQWEKGMEAQLIITNQTEDPIKNWRIQLNFIHEIATIWDAEIESQKEGSYLIKFPSWQPNIPANGKVVVGFTANKNGELQIPSGFLVKSKDTEVKEEDYTIEYKVTSDWKDAFNAEISIKNNTQKKIEGWKLEFDFSS